MHYSGYIIEDATQDFCTNAFKQQPTPVKDGILPTEPIVVEGHQRHHVPLSNLPGREAATLADRLDDAFIFRFAGRYVLSVTATTDFFNALPVADDHWPVADFCAYRDARLHLIDPVVQRHVPGALRDEFCGAKIIYQDIVMTHTAVSYAQIVEQLHVTQGLHMLAVSERLRHDIEILLQVYDETPYEPSGSLDTVQQTKFATDYANSLIDSMADAQWGSAVTGGWIEPYWTESTRRQVIATAKSFYAEHRGDICSEDAPSVQWIASELAHRHSFAGEPMTGRTLKEDIVIQRIQRAADQHFPTYTIADDAEVQIQEQGDG